MKTLEIFYKKRLIKLEIEEELRVYSARYYINGEYICKASVSEDDEDDAIIFLTRENCLKRAFERWIDKHIVE